MEIACPIYGDDLVFCGESEEDLKAMVGRFVEMCKKWVLKSTDKSKVMMLGGEGVSVCDWSMYKSLNTWGILDEKGTVLSSSH